MWLPISYSFTLFIVIQATVNFKFTETIKHVDKSLIESVVQNISKARNDLEMLITDYELQKNNRKAFKNNELKEDTDLSSNKNIEPKNYKIKNVNRRQNTIKPYSEVFKENEKEDHNDGNVTLNKKESGKKKKKIGRKKDNNKNNLTKDAKVNVDGCRSTLGIPVVVFLDTQKAYQARMDLEKKARKKNVKIKTWEPVHTKDNKNKTKVRSRRSVSKEEGVLKKDKNIFNTSVANSTIKQDVNRTGLLRQKITDTSCLKNQVSKCEKACKRTLTFTKPFTKWGSSTRYYFKSRSKELCKEKFADFGNFRRSNCSQVLNSSIYYWNSTANSTMPNFYAKVQGNGENTTTLKPSEKGSTTLEEDQNLLRLRNYAKECRKYCTINCIKACRGAYVNTCDKYNCPNTMTKSNYKKQCTRQCKRVYLANKLQLKDFDVGEVRDSESSEDDKKRPKHYDIGSEDTSDSYEDSGSHHYYDE